MYKLSTLDNGLRVLTVEIPHLQSVSLGFFIAVGSRYECDALAGASHFVEHMLFKGTDRRPTAREIAEAIEGKGGIFNASTGLETTLYWAKVAASHLPEALDVMSDMLLNARFDANEIDKERSVINEEISYTFDAPDSLAQILASRMQWPDHPLGRDVAGTLGSVADLGRNELLAYRSEHYLPGETLLSVAGAVDHKEIVALVDRNLGCWQAGPRTSYDPAPEPVYSDDPCVHVEQKDTEQAQLSFSFAGISRKHPDRFALRLLNILLGEGMRSRLFQEVRERLGLAYIVGSYVSTLQDTGAVGIFAGTAAKRTEDAIDAILTQVDGFRRQPVTQSELDGVREFVRGRLALSLEDSFTLAAWYARQMLLETELVGPEESLKRVEAVEIDDLHRIAEELFRPERLNLAIVGPFSENGDRFREAARF